MTSPTSAAAQFDALTNEYEDDFATMLDESSLNGLKQLAHGARVLDVGCGGGQLALALASVAERVVGIDLAPAMVRRARANASARGAANSEFFVADLAALPFGEESFDLIVSTFALHHVEQRATLNFLKGMVRAGGWLYVREPVRPDGVWPRVLRHRWQGLRHSVRMARANGVGSGLAMLRFTQRADWVRHEAEDELWTWTQARDRYGEALPGATVQVRQADDVAVIIWQRQLRAEAGRGMDEAAVRPRREYRGRRPTGWVEFPREAIEGTVTARFERMALLHGEREAIRTPAGGMTYGELNAAANGVTKAILEIDEQPRVVGVVMDQEDSAAVALLGILKAGCAYVVIDPADPEERRERILELVEADVVLTTRMRAAVLRGTRVRHVVCIEDVEPMNENPQVRATADTMAAIFFTSGSTGEPKGVWRDHRQLLHSTWLNTNTYFVAPEDRVTLLYFPGFTASVPNLFDALLNGATLCARNPRDVDGREMLEWLRRERITHANPSIGVYRSMIAAAQGDESCFADLRLMTLSGQTCFGKDVRAFREVFGTDAVLLYVLAMTEAGAVTQAYYDAAVHVEDGALPIGYAVADKELRILDEDGADASSGEYGLLGIRSRYLSRGYWQDNEQTAARFVHEEGDVIGMRTYRTSDRARVRADGCLEFGGREDSVVKVRGYRVDLAAIEATLNAHPDVRAAAAAAARTAADGEASVSAYVEWTGERAFRVDEMKAYLRTRLPSYMTPARMMAMERLPLGPTGKIDRTALPLIGAVRPDLSTPYTAPRTETEHVIASIWADVLQLERVGVDDRFSDLGGDSILSALVMTRVGNALKPSGSLAEMIRCETVTAMAKWVDGDKSLPSHSSTKVRVPYQLGPLGELGKLGRIWWRGPWVKGRMLAYGPGVRLQQLWLRAPMNRSELRRQAAPLYEWMQRMGIDEASAEGSWLIESSVLANTWRNWRVRVFEDWMPRPGSVVIEGDLNLRTVLESGRSVMLLGYHNRLMPLTKLMNVVLPRFDRQCSVGLFGGIAGNTVKHVLARTAHAEAFGELERGGVVVGLVDGASGAGGQWISLYGIPFQVRSGAARLAVETGASVVPMTWRLDLAHDICLRLKFHEPLPMDELESLPRAERIAALTRRCGEFMTKNLPVMLETMDWRTMQRILDNGTGED